MFKDPKVFKICQNHRIMIYHVALDSYTISSSVSEIVSALFTVLKLYDNYELQCQKSDNLNYCFGKPLHFEPYRWKIMAF